MKHLITFVQRSLAKASSVLHVHALNCPQYLNICVGTRQTLLIVTGKNLASTFQPNCSASNVFQVQLDKHWFRNASLLGTSGKKLFVSLSHWATISKSVLRHYSSPFDGGPGLFLLFCHVDASFTMSTTFARQSSK